MNKIIGVNGLYVSPTKVSNTDKLLRELEATYPLIPLVDYQYPYTNLLGRYFRSHITGNAKRLVKDNPTKKNIVFCHSAGALLVNTACQEGARFKAIVIFSGALDSSEPWREEWADAIINVYNPRDWVLIVSSIVPFHSFGQLGSRGYRGPHNPKLININARDVHMKNSWLRPHSDYFRKENVGNWADLLCKMYYDKRSKS